MFVTVAVRADRTKIVNSFVTTGCADGGGGSGVDGKKNEADRFDILASDWKRRHEEMI